MPGIAVRIVLLGEHAGQPGSVEECHREDHGRHLPDALQLHRYARAAGRPLECISTRMLSVPSIRRRAASSSRSRPVVKLPTVTVPVVCVVDNSSATSVFEARTAVVAAFAPGSDMRSTLSNVGTVPGQITALPEDVEALTVRRVADTMHCSELWRADPPGKQRSRPMQRKFRNRPRPAGVDQVDIGGACNEEFSDVLDVPSQEISGDVRAEQFRPNLVLAAVLGSLEDEELPVGAPDQRDFGTRPGWTFLRHSPGIEVLAKIQRDISVVAQAAFSSATSPTGTRRRSMRQPYSVLARN